MHKTLISVLLLAFSSLSPAIPLTGTVYEKDTNKQKMLFDWQRLETPEGTGLQIKTIFTSPDKTVAATEEVLLEGGKIKTYSVHQNQLGEKGSLEVKGNKIYFSYTRGSETKTSDEDLPDNLAIGPTLVDYLTQRKETLFNGGTISVRFAVLDRRETVGFKFFKDSDGSYQGKPTIVVKMKPSSFVIAAIVDPLYFTFQKDGMKLVELVGRTLPKRQVDGKWKDLDADIWYRWP